jgi:hypothetical protein
MFLLIVSKCILIVSLHNLAKGREGSEPLRRQQRKHGLLLIYPFAFFCTLDSYDLLA